VTDPAQRPAGPPIDSLDDPRALQILTTEHSSLVSSRSLAYNEAFTRGDMFLGFLSMSLVAIALLAQAISIDQGFLTVVAVVLAFDLVVGLTTYGRIIAANYEDYRSVWGMARIRHGYGQVAPVVLPYITTSRHDDLAGVMVSYGSPPTGGLTAVFHGLTTSAGMIGLIVAMVAAVLVLVVSLVIGIEVIVAFLIAGIAGLGLLVGLIALTIRFYLRVQSRLEVLFPTPAGEPEPAEEGHG
jgi:hypothetical protein